jgi:putative ABC transport system permease protein
LAPDARATRKPLELMDALSLSGGAIRAYPLRSLLSALGIGIGVMAVVLLTSIGEGTRRYVVEQFTQFGTNIIAINPGKTETGGMPGIFGGTTQKLSIADAEAIARLPDVQKVVPMSVGQARVEGNNRGRSVYVYGSSSDLPEVFKFGVGQGQFVPKSDPRRGSNVAVLGPTLKRELFEESNALGQFVRIAGVRFRVIGIMEPKGQMLGFDIDDAIYIPLASSMQLFNQDELNEIDVTFAHEDMTEALAESIRSLLTERHNHKEDFTITTQTAMIETSGKVMNIVTLSVGAIAGISLFVGAVGIFTMMWISVGERTSEIGLLRAVGATQNQVLYLFLLEAVLLTTGGGAAGALAALGLGGLLRAAVPGLPVYTDPIYILAALGMSTLTGLASGLAPARRAASLPPVESLRSE